MCYILITTLHDNLFYKYCYVRNFDAGIACISVDFMYLLDERSNFNWEFVDRYGATGVVRSRFH